MLDQNHPDISKALNSLARVLHERGQYGEAAALLRESLPIARAAYGDEHPMVANCLVKLAAVDLAQGEAAAAEPLARRGVEILCGRMAKEIGRLRQPRACSAPS